MHVKIRKRIGNPTLYNAKINYSLHKTKIIVGIIKGYENRDFFLRIVYFII